ncbi:MAG TPA: hypothetical protein VN577_24080 [Terriglobales bacterium]|nr:hypothetical protein [Terriglobales bacterium]
MKKKYSASIVLGVVALLFACARGFNGTDGNSQVSPGSSSQTGKQGLSGVLMWKGDTTGTGLYANETVLTTQNVNPQQFGKIQQKALDGMIIAQPLFVSQLNMGDKGVHDVVIVVTEHNSVYAFDAKDPEAPLLWERHYSVDGATPAADNFGGRTTIGGEIGITGTPAIDPATGAMYFVTMLQKDGKVDQWLRAIDIKTGNDFGPGSVKIQGSVQGDGRGSDGGTIHFDPTNHNQRAGLVITNGAVIICWGSFSDWGVYHGWVMAYGLADLQQKAVLNLSPQHQDQDYAFGPADFGGGASVWQAGAAPSVDASGNIYMVAADGSFNADKGGLNFGDTVVKVRFSGTGFEVTDWFGPSNHPCVDAADMEIGSGGLVLLPSGGLGVTINKEGRVYLLNLSNLGKVAPGDTQIPQQFMAGNQECYEGLGPDHAEGTDWQRLYGNPSYWNGNLYLAPSNTSLIQYSVQNNRINTTPAARTTVATGLRGGNTVVSANGTNNAIVWMYQKAASGQAILHAFDATNVSKELWNSNMTGGDEMGIGIGFGTPVVANGRVFTTFNKSLVIYGPR